MQRTYFGKSLPLMLSFLVYSMVLNCLGIIILQLFRQEASYAGLGALEAFKDLPIALASLFAANYVSRFGTKASLIFALSVVALSCIAVPFMGKLLLFKIWFVLIGLGFSVAKISVIGMIKNNFPAENILAQVMNRTEAAFMLGIFMVNTGFGWLLQSAWAAHWKFGFWAIAGLALLNIFLLLKQDYSEIRLVQNPSLSTIKGIFRPRTLLFFLIIFCIVFTEQGFNTWLPVFFKNFIGVDSYFALQSSAFMALFSFLGRLATGRFVARFSAYQILMTVLFCAVAVLVDCHFLLFSGAENVHFLLFLLPLVGFFMAPLYPLYNSLLLAKVSEEKVSVLVSAVVIFSSFGSSLGSILTAEIFQNGMGSYYAMYLAGVLMIILILTAIFSAKFISD